MKNYLPNIKTQDCFNQYTLIARHTTSFHQLITVPKNCKRKIFFNVQRVYNTIVHMTLPYSLFTKVLMLVKILKFDGILKVSG